ncbi:MAG: hypothetical protein IH587_05840, partial [Anaerolineae bacterium]|nr:hypothetical protein [Anaerolineae bacterium]
MKLSHKLLVSYIVVVGVGLVVLSLATAFVAPVNFTEQMAHMRGNTSGMMGQQMAELDAELEAGFRDAITNALIIAGFTAIRAAIGASWFMSQRIVNP